MHHPVGRCDRCGERLYSHVDGGTVCHNCGARYESETGDGDATNTDQSDGGTGAAQPVPLPQA